MTVLGINTKELTCWIVQQAYMQLCERPAHCLPTWPGHLAFPPAFGVASVVALQCFNMWQWYLIIVLMNSSLMTYDCSTFSCADLSFVCLLGGGVSG